MASVVFNEKPGEIYDIFGGLWTIGNHEIAKQKKEKLGINEENSYERILLSLAEEEKVDMKIIEKYFHQDFDVEMMNLMNDLWTYTNLEDYLKYLCTLDELEIRERIVNSIRIEIEGLLDDEVKSIAESNEKVLEYIMNKDISSGLKWEIYLLLSDTKDYIEKYTRFIQEYAKIHSVAMKIRKDLMKELNLMLEENINNYGITYLSQLVNNIVNFEKYEKIYVTTSATKTLYIADEIESRNCYIIIGENLKDVWDNMNTVESNLEILRDVFESTRFKIIKLLLERAYYAQEIANTLDLSKANVSYHMNFLLKSKVAKIEKEGQRNYYYLDKDRIGKSLEFIQGELGL